MDHPHPHRQAPSTRNRAARLTYADKCGSFPADTRAAAMTQCSQARTHRVAPASVASGAVKIGTGVILPQVQLATIVAMPRGSAQLSAETGSLSPKQEQRSFVGLESHPASASTANQHYSPPVAQVQSARAQAPPGPGHPGPGHPGPGHPGRAKAAAPAWSAKTATKGSCSYVAPSSRAPRGPQGRGLPPSTSPHGGAQATNPASGYSPPKRRAAPLLVHQAKVQKTMGRPWR
ncbi:spidroin-2-like [Thrips palmi]|uniref:Spidroin-2-like n=1 Tax=Thrips palmi TaxID=161013 RepID=A0A6P8Y637_THRPL|nr:spidroin-2-like [Thrips palmi]